MLWRNALVLLGCSALPTELHQTLSAINLFFFCVALIHSREKPQRRVSLEIAQLIIVVCLTFN